MGVGLKAPKLLGRRRSGRLAFVADAVQAGWGDVDRRCTGRVSFCAVFRAGFRSATAFCDRGAVSCAAVVFRSDMDAAVLAVLPDVRIGLIEECVDGLSADRRGLHDAGWDCAGGALQGTVCAGFGTVAPQLACICGTFPKILIFDPVVGGIVFLDG